MIRHLILPLALGAFIVLAGEKFGKADRIPATPTPEQRALIAEGVALHEARDYNGAISR